jgi:EmrB/QacA subfamily drug resistance transporter
MTSRTPTAAVGGVSTSDITGRPTGWAALVIVLAADFMITLDFFIINVAIPSIHRDLHAGPAAIQFVVVGYGLAFAGGLITWGRLGDICGRRRLFAIGLLGFTAASAVCGFAPSAGLLVAARVVQGIAAGVVAPQVLAIVTTTYTGTERMRAFAVAGLSKGLAGVFGQLIGGALIETGAFGFGWRLCFLINLPVGIAVLAAVPRVLRESRVDIRPRLDVAGAVLVTTGLVALVLPLVAGRAQGWPAWSWASLAAAAVLLAVFVAHQRFLTARERSPLVDTGLFRLRSFALGALATALFYAGMGAFLLVFALYLQDGLGRDALQSGLIYTVIGAGFFVIMLRAAAIGRRYGVRGLALGAVLVAAGWAGLALTVGERGSVLWLTPALLVCGLGLGLVLSQLTAVSIAAVPARHTGAASGVLNTAVQVGSAVGTALIGISFYGVLGESPTPADYPGALEASLAGLVVLGLVVALLIRRLPNYQRQPRPTQ